MHLYQHGELSECYYSNLQILHIFFDSSRDYRIFIWIESFRDTQFISIRIEEHTRQRRKPNHFRLGWDTTQDCFLFGVEWEKSSLALVSRSASILCENGGRIDISDANRWMEGTMFVSRSSDTRVRWHAHFIITDWKIEKVLHEVHFNLTFYLVQFS